MTEGSFFAFGVGNDRLFSYNVSKATRDINIPKNVETYINAVNGVMKRLGKTSFLNLSHLISAFLAYKAYKGRRQGFSKSI